MKRTLSLLLLFLLSPLSAYAQSEELPSETSPWTLRAGVKTSLFLSPTPNLELAYRLPDDHWEILVHGSSPLRLSYSSLQMGGRYYFNPEAQDFNFFAVARVGAYVFDSTSTIYNPGGSTDTVGGLQFNPDIAAGLGVDWNWTPNLGLTGSLYGGLPIFFFPEIALKYTF